MALKVADAINWRIRLDGSGTVYIEPKPTEAVAVFDGTTNDVVEPEVSEEFDWYSCPNVLQVVKDDVVAVARDDSEDSVYSTVSRGREIWAQESSVDLASNESLAAYASRRLKELQTVQRKVSYKRRFSPDVYVGDLIRLNYPQVELSGLFRVESQTYDLGLGCSVSEEVTEV